MTTQPTLQMSEAVVAPDCSIISGATKCTSDRNSSTETDKRTPIWTPDDCSVLYTSCLCGHSEIRQLDRSIFVGEDVGALDVAMNNTLVVQIDEPFQHLRDVHCHQVFRKLSESLGDVVQRTILTEPKGISLEKIREETMVLLKDDVEKLACLDEPLVLDNVRMLKLLVHWFRRVKSRTSHSNS